MSQPRLLVTGATGFLGKTLVPLLREKYEIDLVSRSASGALRGDLSKWNGGFGDLEALRGRDYQAFVHLAGLYDLSASAADCFLNNVAGTSNALRVAKILDIPVFLNASSVAAAINSKLPVVKPYDLNFGSSFPDAYSESKALGEQMIHNWEGGPGLRVNLRLGVLVGSSADGKIDRIDGPYHAPQALNRIRPFIENFPTAFPLPGDDRRRIPLVPVDACARAIGRMIEWSLSTDESGYRSYHLTPERGLAVRDLYKATLRHLHIRNKGLALVDRVPVGVVKKISKWAIRFPEEELSYLLGFPKYDTAGARRILGDGWCPEFEDYEQAFWRGYEDHVSHR